MASTNSAADVNFSKPAAPRALSSAQELCHIGFLLAIVLVAAIPLIVLRNSRTLGSVVPSVLLAEVLIAALWLKACRLRRPACVTNTFRTWEVVACVLALSVVMYLSFYLPLRANFWGGWDEQTAYNPLINRFWSTAFDLRQNRPAIGWSYVIAHSLAGGRIEGFLWLAAAENLISGLLLAAIVALLFPHCKSLALAAGALYIVNPLDPLRFYPLWAANLYGLAVAFLLLAVLTFLISWRRQNRGLLLGSCAALVCSLFMYEVGYLLAAIPVVLVWLERRAHATWRLWLFGWIATWALMAARFAIFLLTSRTTYQMQQAEQARRDLSHLLDNLANHLQPTANFFDFNAAAWPWLVPGIVVFALIAGLSAWLTRNEQRPTAAQLFWGIMLAAGGMLLGLAPYSHLPGNERTQFFAAPSIVLLIILGVACVCRLLPQRVAGFTFALLVGVLCGNATVQSLQSQNMARNVSYEKTVRVFEQLAAVCPHNANDKLIVLLFEGTSPLGSDYCVYLGSEHWLGTTVAAVGDERNQFVPVVCDEDAIIIERRGQREKAFTYENVIIFKLEQDGTLHLATQWPAAKLGTHGASRYAPLNLLAAAPIPPLKYLNYPSWIERPRDVMDQRQGVVFATGWSPLKYDAGYLYRDVAQDAQLLVNSQGEPQISLQLDVSPAAQLSSETVLEVLNDQGEAVHRVQLHDRQRLKLDLPCDTAAPSLFTLHLRSAAPLSRGRKGVLRVYSPGGALDQNPFQPREDITVGDIALGGGWYPYEVHGDLKLRWVNTDAVVYSGPCDAGAKPALQLEVTPGPGMAGSPCSLELTTTSGVSLGCETVAERKVVTFTLPAEFPEGSELTLRIIGGGRQVGVDPRFLNVMVTQCVWQPNAEALARGTGEALQR